MKTKNTKSEDNINIFLKKSANNVVTRFAEKFYDLLMTRELVSRTDVVYAADCNIKPGYFDKHNISSYDQDNALKKGIKLVRDELNKRIPGSVIDNGKTKGVAYKYVGNIDDPLGEERKHYRQKSMDDFVRFSREVICFLPPGWFSSYFEDSDFLLQTRRDVDNQGSFVGSSHEHKLTNIELLPVLYKAITDHQALVLDYKPYSGEIRTITLHPHYLKEYNYRWFVLGKCEDSVRDVEIFALDRIIPDSIDEAVIDYLPAEMGYYHEYFKNIVGVSHNKDFRAFDIKIRTHTKYHHGLVTTKPFHHSQKELIFFGTHEDGNYGEVTIHVEPTRELFGRILSLGRNLEIVSPIEVRYQFAEFVKDIYLRYSHD